jgi:hypothetical protein
MADDKHISFGNLAKFKEKYDEKVSDELASKVDVVEGKGLSANDFTNELKATLESALQTDDLTDYAKKTDISSVFKYKGSVENYSDLPVENSVGDTYNIINADTEHNIDAGDNLTWNGEAWDNLSGIINLTPINTKLSEMETSISNIGKVEFVNKKDIDDMFKVPYLTFETTNHEMINLAKPYQINWDGVLEYSTDTINWHEITSNTSNYIKFSPTGKLYLRGLNNTVINSTFQFNAPYDTRVKCIGNLENLLDYQKVANGEHPTMGENCFNGLFRGNNFLVSAPELPATILSKNCYSNMFNWCINLTEAPELPATTLAESCYEYMLYGTAITEAPELPATTLAKNCYGNMFYNTKITKTPKLSATKLAYGCYNNMFSSCASLTQISELPATELAERCYNNMFYGCTSLTAPIDLPATVLAKDCYVYMFMGCTSLTGVVHCPASVENDPNNISNGHGFAQDYFGAELPNVTVVYDL